MIWNLPSRLVFQHVVRLGSFSQAAELGELGLSEAAIRKHVRNLEQELGVRLLERKPLRVTPTGRILYEYDRPLLAKLLRAADHLERKVSPKLTVGVTGSAAKLFLLGPVSAWLYDPGREPIDCRFGSLHELRPDLESGELDLLITALDGPAPVGFAQHIMARFPLVLILPANDRLGSAAELWADRRPAPHLIAPEADDPVTQVFRAGLERGGITWPTRLTCDSPASMVQLVLFGLGYGLSLAAEPCSARGAKNEKEPPRQSTRLASGRPRVGLARRAGRDGSNEVKSSRSRSQSPISDLPSAGAAQSAAFRGIREIPLPGFDAVPIVALWRPEDSTRLKAPLRLIRAC